MKAIQYHGNHRLELTEVSDPVAGFDDVLMKPLAVGICGTDLHIVEGNYPSVPPLTIGHEVAGVVKELGKNVTHLKVGDLITVEPHKYCGSCIYCQIGYEHMCIDKLAYGVHLPGGMAELQVIPSKIAYKLPEGITPQIGALTEPLACCIHALDRLDPLSGLPILIVGAGPAGALLVTLAKYRGLSPIYSVDNRKDRRDLGELMGADAVFTSIDEAKESLQSNFNISDFPYVVDAVGSPDILNKALEVVSRRGTILVFGVAHPDAKWVTNPNQIYAKELTIIGSAINPFTHRRAIGLLERLPLGNLRIKTFNFKDLKVAFEAQVDGTYDKIQFSPEGGS
jgi:threonine dehydrogenase-like Zn-dependent dehydrogenase